MVITLLNQFKEVPFKPKEILVLAAALEKGFVDRKYLTEELNIKMTNLRVLLSQIRVKGGIDKDDNLSQYLLDLDKKILKLEIYAVQES